MVTTGTNLVRIEDGSPEEVDRVHTYGDLPTIEIGRQEYYLARDREQAGEAVRKRWQDMKDNDKREFRCMIGDDRLVQWACGEYDAFGISSFDEFLERVGEEPGEELAGYDGSEREAKINLPLARKLEWESIIPGEASGLMDVASLREALTSGDIAIPDELRAAHVHIDADPETMTDADADLWIAILNVGEESDSLNADGAITEILDTFRFVECVAYRHN